MNHEKETNQRVLAIYPIKTGFAYCYFEGPKDLTDWGNCYLRPEDINEKLQSLVDTFRPEVIVTEDNNGIGYQRSKHISVALDDVYDLAEQNQILLKKYTRAAVKAFFNNFGAKNIQEIAILLSTWFPGLTKLPPEPKLWAKKHYRTTLFDAISFALTTTTETTNPRGGISCQIRKYYPNA